MVQATQVGVGRAYFQDFYAWMLRASWGWVLLLFGAALLTIHLSFATLFWLAGDAIAGAKPGSFIDALHFSVQTLSTIGYGQMAPQNLGHTIVALESAVGMLVVALATGVVFSKFARPTARVMFSRRMVIQPHNAVRTLTFRIANARGSEIIEAQVRCTALMSTVSAEGERMRILHDMNLRRDTNPVFAMSWAVMHEIDDKSPLKNMTLEELDAGDVRIVVSFTGIDNVLSQTVHAHYMYFVEDIDDHHRFVDVISRPPKGGIQIDLSKFHDTEPLPPAKVATAEKSA